jgi:Domain of unknown function (DUF4465)
MKRWMILALTLALAPTARADYISTFEDLGLPANSFNNNLGTNGYFNSGGNFFNNNFNSTFGAWAGWSISSQNMVPTPPLTNPDYTYQYLAYPGIGGNGSQTYAVANTFGPGADPFHPSTSIVNLGAGASPVSIQITNTAYDYFSMSLGDSFAHKFGAGDFLLLTIDGYSSSNGGGTKVGEVDFYLANFLGTNPSQYYIVSTWQTVDLSSLVGAQSLAFGLESTDNDPIFGMNTPAEFAADNLIAASAVPEPSSLLLCLTGIGIGTGALIARRSKASRLSLDK